jgi:hypothetical protein
LALVLAHASAEDERQFEAARASRRPRNALANESYAQNCSKSLRGGRGHRCGAIAGSYGVRGVEAAPVRVNERGRYNTPMAAWSVYEGVCRPNTRLRIGDAQPKWLLGTVRLYVKRPADPAEVNRAE